MLFPAIFFYMFGATCVAAAFMVIASRNPVHSVLFLILAFVNAAGLFVLLGAEFLAMILIIVYVGAVLVMFLFVVMMLDVDFSRLRQGFLQYLPVGALVGIILLIELLLVVFTWSIGANVRAAIATPIPPLAKVTNTEALGHVLYTDYIYFFQVPSCLRCTTSQWSSDRILPTRLPERRRPRSRSSRSSRARDFRTVAG